MCSKPIFCSKIALKGKTCSRLLKPQKVAPNAKSCSKVAEHNRDRPKCRIKSGDKGWGVLPLPLLYANCKQSNLSIIQAKQSGVLFRFTSTRVPWFQAHYTSHSSVSLTPIFSPSNLRSPISWSMVFFSQFLTHFVNSLEWIMCTKHIHSPVSSDTISTSLTSRSILSRQSAGTQSTS